MTASSSGIERRAARLVSSGPTADLDRSGYAIAFHWSTRDLARTGLPYLRLGEASSRAAADLGEVVRPPRALQREGGLNLAVRGPVEVDAFEERWPCPREVANGYVRAAECG